MYILPLERENVLKSLFNTRVLDTMRQHKALMEPELRETDAQQIKQCFHTYYTTRPFVWIKKSRPQYPYSVLIIKDEPFLVLPTPAEWKIKPHSNAAPKTLISLTTGELKFLKVYRPKNENDTYPAASSAKDLENRTKWGEETILHTRKSTLGVKHYLLMPHYGVSFEKFLDSPNITPRQMLDALIQAAEQVKKWHDKGFLHLDLKASNMMYDPTSNIARLIDFETMVPDQTVVPVALGTIPFMHPERLVQMSPSCIVRKKGNITCTKSEDIFTFLQAIKDTLFIAEWKEETAYGKSVFTLALKEFLEQAYQGLNLNGKRRAKPLAQMPTIDHVLSMLKQTRQEYDLILSKPALPKVEMPKFVPQYQVMPMMPSPRPQPLTLYPPSPKIGIPYCAMPSPRLQQSLIYSPSPRITPHPVMPSPRLQQSIPQFVHAAPQGGSQPKPSLGIHYQYQSSPKTRAGVVMPSYRPKW